MSYYYTCDASKSRYRSNGQSGESETGNEMLFVYVIGFVLLCFCGVLCGYLYYKRSQKGKINTVRLEHADCSLCIDHGESYNT